MNKQAVFGALLFLVFCGHIALASGWKVEGACSRSEHWTFGEGLDPKAREEFRLFLNHKISPPHAFSDALLLRKWFASGASRRFGEYWASRALYEAKLTHLASRGFTALISNPPKPETAAIQLAALECAVLIARRYPSLSLPEEIGRLLPQYASFFPSHPVLQEYSLHLLKQQIAEKKSMAEISKTLSYLRGGGLSEVFAGGIVAAHEGNHSQVVTALSRFVRQVAPLDPLRRYLDQALLLLARAHFSLGSFEQSANLFKQMRKNSNELAKSLSELAWSQLQDGKVADAIGTAINLESGGLRKTFAPEAPMVMAMALNEICQFPESLKAIRIFFKRYEESYRWLENWYRKPFPLYAHAVQYLQFKPDAPVRISSEWIRSPVFISHQDEINGLDAEATAATAFGRSGGEEQREWAKSIVAMARELKPAIVEARSKIEPWESLPPALRSRVVQLKEMLRHWRGFQEAAPRWRVALDRHHSDAIQLRSRRIAAINDDLKQRSIKMLRQLEEISENHQLIEVEIFQGASEDIIWQNSYPDYKKIAQKLRKEEARSASGSTWDWGRRPALSEEESEIWEDELGSFKANLFDNCSSKEKYLALRGEEKK